MGKKLPFDNGTLDDRRKYDIAEIVNYNERGRAPDYKQAEVTGRV